MLESPPSAMQIVRIANMYNIVALEIDLNLGDSDLHVENSMVSCNMTSRANHPSDLAAMQQGSRTE